ncbi:MAG: hypothetical protein H8E36_08715 [Rhodospirillaceae bacterium]|nr:hypothetical protein [Rhodospirillaceae bacterium]MBL6942108.1 hypothetical protein [Rhodospirillales bacterium]
MSNTTGVCKAVSHRIGINAQASGIFPLLCWRSRGISEDEIRQIRNLGQKA